MEDGADVAGISLTSLGHYVSLYGTFDVYVSASVWVGTLRRVLVAPNKKNIVFSCGCNGEALSVGPTVSTTANQHM